MARVFGRIADWFGDLVDLVAPVPVPGEGIDVHCHLFNLNTALTYLMKGAIDVATRLLEEGSWRGASAAEGGGEAAAAIQRQDMAARSRELLGYLKAAAVWLSPDSRKVYRYLRRRDKYGFRIVALTLDFDCHANAAARERFRRYFDRTAERLRPQLEKLGGPLSSKAVKLFTKLTDRIDKGFDARLRSVDFYEQADEIARIVRKYDGVYAFLAVDPRQPRILDYVKEKVGPGRDFRGIKLYAPMGYSPTDELLFDRKREGGCLYDYCEGGGIPITAHSSPDGFGTAADSVYVKGHIYAAPGESVMVDNKLVSGEGVVAIDGVVKFKKNFPEADQFAVFEERSRILNNPLLWREVLKEYPRLRINLAHFGGHQEITAYADDAESGKAAGSQSWSKTIADLMDTYENAYTDLACQSYYDVVRRFKSVLWNGGVLSAKAKDKVMYGSDWDVLFFRERDLERYVREFSAIFGAEFDALSVANPKRFLGL